MSHPPLAQVKPPSQVPQAEWDTSVAALVLFVTNVWLSAAEPAVDAAAAPVNWVTGRKAEESLSRPVLASWQNVPLREVLQRLSRVEGLSILLDRRLDPGREVSLETKEGLPLREVLQKLAQGAGISLCGNCLYLGPQPAAERIRTLIELREAELSTRLPTWPAPRRRELAARRTIDWQDLDTPREILDQMLAGWSLTASGSEQVPHDLWARGTLPRANVSEALSLLLIQFELTFSWNADGDGITITPTPEVVELERTLALPRSRTAEFAQDLAARMPGATVTVKDQKVTVRGTLEQIDTVESALRGGKQAEPPPPVAKEPLLLNKRQFTLRLKDTPASALMRELEKSGVVFVYDAETLSARSIDLNQRITVDVKDAKASEFFAAVFDPLGLTFEIDGVKVTLRPQ